MPERLVFVDPDPLSREARAGGLGSNPAPCSCGNAPRFRG